MFIAPTAAPGASGLARVAPASVTPNGRPAATPISAAAAASRAVPGTRNRTTIPSVPARKLAGTLGIVVLFLAPGTALDAAAAALIGVAAGLPFGVTLAGATRARPEAPGAAVGAMNIYPVLAIVCGAPLVGLTFSLTGRGRIGFAVLAAMWSGALLVLKGLDI